MAETLMLEITGLTHDGRGVGRHDGLAVFVAGALPEETVRARITRRKRRFAEAELIEILTPSPQRQTPFCPHFGRCGGCQLQHLQPAAQHHWKQHNLLQQLARHGLDDLLRWHEPIIGPDQGYRRRARFAGIRTRKGGQLGFRAARSRDIVDIESCPVLEEPLNAAWQQRRSALSGQLGRSPQEWTLVNADNGVFWADQHAETLPEYQVDGLALQFDPAGFIQVNRTINASMVAQAVAWLAPTAGDHVLDLFCGVGNFSLPLAKRAAAVVGVEGLDSLVAHARANAARNGLNNVRFFKSNLFNPPQESLWAGVRFNKVLLDPGREGAEAVSRWLTPKMAEAVVYVSCNPATLVRDAVLLRENGWRLHDIRLLDMFPHTSHVEVMARFES
ncbi:23S rRNA m(5)U-1939 methyltransferase [Sulfurivirga caldicuralii]|uniref:23S rRNA m(5)U-1939 methyltransferase n=1 Tax=Sulfurivirga caldicuralii TaxID=364032 RepID=A0A1N6GD02_9GAMM|nr:23S rRNA (uracil(1939)-C(5))-methyltransferase RlmD [Sulfurivirga caldicuralii]SIO05364.1 23S rRNA m(5)U-1939 methyltransferase [Sulfurivirga caldicuralii]